MDFSLSQLTAVKGGGMALPRGVTSALRGNATEFAALLGSNLTALLPNAAPAAPLVSSIAKELTNALLRATGSTRDANARSTLQRALTAALAPPGTSPPQAATLEQRLIGLLETLTGTTAKNNAGQKNEIPGHLLDAKPAKEPPAPQTKNAHAALIEDDVAAFARALLAQAAQAAAPAASPGQTPIAAPAQDAPAAPAANADSAVNDVLSRILTRAFSANAQNAETAPPQASRSTGASAAVSSPSAVFERLVALIASPSQNGGGAGMQTGDHFQRQSAAPLQTQAALAMQTDPGSTAAAAATAAGHTPAADATATLPERPIAPYTAVDANAVIEQMVKGIVIQSSGESSQIRLRLQPEHLGEVALKITVTGNSISANVLAQNAGMRDVLLAGHTQLARALGDAGLTLGTFSVGVSGNQTGSAGDRETAGQQHANYKLGGWQAGLNHNDDQAVYDARFGPPIATGPGSLVINSLV
ncbi:MAG: flagellar hook-length control protein FliK [Candidatus Baltobacteraceae bacterium]